MTHTMSRETFDEWIEALNSGAYKQGKGVLCRVVKPDTKECEYCCLGVLAEVLNLKKELPKAHGAVIFDGGNPQEPFVTILDETLGLKHKGMCMLTRMNDTYGLTFEQIAYELTANPETFVNLEERA
jgi:hypothetical protein